MAVTHVTTVAEFDRGEIEVTGEAYRHLFRARRLAADEPVRVVDGCGRAASATVGSIDAKRALLVLGGEMPANEPDQRVDLYVAPPRPERLAWLVEKATEIGVRAVHLLATERAERAPGSGRIARLERVARGAVQQSHRALVPIVTAPRSLAEVAASGWAGLPVWVLDTADPPLAVLPSSSDGAIVVGPEGGWSSAERDQFDALGLSRVSLGPRVLRVETAATVAASRLLFV